MIRHCIAYPLLLVCLGASAAAAQNVTPPAPPPAAPPYPRIHVGATLFTDYTYTSEPVRRDEAGREYSPSSFNVTRGYINLTAALSPVIEFRLTPDIAPETGSGSSLNGSLTFRMKYAYLQTNFDRWLTRGTWARFGMQPTAFVNFAEDLYRYRFQGTIMVDREGYLSSSDVGAAFHYSVPGDYGDVHFGVYNGETFRQTERNDQKALQLRGTVRPFPGVAIVRGLRLTGFLHNDFYVRDAERRRAMGSVTFEHPYLNAAFDYLDAADQQSPAAATIDGSGWSFWATPRTPVGWEGLVRFDRLVPDARRASEVKTRTILGVAYWLSLPAKVSTAFLFDSERVVYNDFVPARSTEQRFAVHMLVTF